MTAGRVLTVFMLATAVVTGAAIYWLQVYAYYETVTAEAAGEVQMVSLVSGEPEVIEYEGFQGIDSDSSPIRFRACFTTPIGQATLSETYVGYPDATPLVAPGWFDCFDAVEVGEALERGEAMAFLGVKDLRYGVDRVVAVMPDGRGFIWHQINDCGAAAFDGNSLPEGCGTPP